MPEALKLQFEQVFLKHYERLTNQTQSVGGQPFTLENIVCFILLGGRELDIEDIYGDVSERYSMEEFLADAHDAGVEADDDLKNAINDLIGKKFLHLQPDGRFYAYQATRDTARMINRIYPKMMGLSLLGYIGQTLQEAESGRIDSETALSRFDQTLQHQGVPLPKPKIPVITPPPKAVSPTAKKVEETKPSSSRIIRDYVVTDQTKARNGEARKAPVADISPPLVERQNEPDRQSESPKPVLSPVRDIDLEPTPLPQAASPVAEEAVIPQEEEPALESEDTATLDDEAIAAKVAAFEQELALLCPICKTNQLNEKQTAAGKLFYTCTSAQCSFISWGRPHHIQCIRCKNPFLVEITDAASRVFLKCPRATCQHRQPLTPDTATGGIRKVVRKRLVRRKA